MQEAEFYGVAFSFCDIMSVLKKFQILENFRFFFDRMLDLHSNKGHFNAKIEKQRIVSKDHGLQMCAL